MVASSATKTWPALAYLPCLLALLAIAAQARADNQRLGRVQGLEGELGEQIGPGPLTQEEVTSCGVSIPLVVGKAAGKPGCRAVELGLEVQGAGAQGCLTGDACSFTVRFFEPAEWPHNASRFFRWAPRVILAGPELIHASISEVPAPLVPPLPIVRTQAFVVTYTAWEPGVYQASLVDQCWALKLQGVKLPAYQGRKYLSLVATWQLEVSRPRATASSSSSQHLALKRRAQEHVPAIEPSPCLQSMPARWVRTSAPLEPQALPLAGKGEADGAGGKAKHGSSDSLKFWEDEYKWVPYGCAKWSSARQVAQLLVQRSVRKVVFIGDSHVRCLMLHAASLLSGSLTRQDLFRSHGDFTFPVALPSHTRTTDPHWPQGEQSGSSGNQHVVEFRFHFIDGVYRNGEFGCTGRGVFTNRTTAFPLLEETPDLAVLGSGAWSAVRCDEPGVAYAKHLEDFLAFYAEQMAQKNVSPGRVTFIGTVPRPSCRREFYKAHRQLLQFVTEVAQVYATNHGFSFFNALEIASPMFHQTCSMGDAHYSCERSTNRTGWVQLTGVVGEAIAQTYLQLLASQVG